ncbi:MAG: lipid A biosynthesis acyltransferase [Odoribacter sp.]|nr:lipid A biosynthesis acyltransferase [Odoribacter sp.]
MGAIGFYLFYGINWIITLLPLRVLYLIADLLYLVLYYFPSYRRKVVAANLRNAFPEKSANELLIIEKGFYKHLAGLFIETFKLTHMSRKNLKKRFVLTNPDIIKKITDQGQDIVAVCGHFNNWEWLAAIPLFTDIKCVSIYKPLKNKLFDRFINDLRHKYGMVITPMSNIVREIIMDRNHGMRTISAFIADQTPAKNDIKYWTQFLCQDTPVYLGAEKIAAKYDMAVVFFNIQKVKRGYYSLTLETLFDHTAGLPEYTVTEAHVRRLEELIRENPEYWIWSHRRWKHKREQKDA